MTSDVATDVRISQNVKRTHPLKRETQMIMLLPRTRSIFHVYRIARSILVVCDASGHQLQCSSHWQMSSVHDVLSYTRSQRGLLPSELDGTCCTEVSRTERLECWGRTGERNRSSWLISSDPTDRHENLWKDRGSGGTRVPPNAQRRMLCACILDISHPYASGRCAIFSRR